MGSRSLANWLCSQMTKLLPVALHDMRSFVSGSSTISKVFLKNGGGDFLNNPSPSHLTSLPLPPPALPIGSTSIAFSFPVCLELLPSFDVFGSMG
ncbi:hypothetical protein RHMOL_Rhmol02G0079800 [Rhododendron molle]|uniref:Uncharacterized protein n=1 Tax=Rhododendron molle TaxID=49168 RepID=A0ACC0PQW7_RHOML|nr:hypothetical protein RHMOL_Rhmol02G0079800 [Rhododendron molle]